MRIIITIFTLLFTAGIAQEGKTDSTLHLSLIHTCDFHL